MEIVYVFAKIILIFIVFATSFRKASEEIKEAIELNAVFIPIKWIAIHIFLFAVLYFAGVCDFKIQLSLLTK